MIEEAIKNYYGERCPDHDADCIVCKAWQEFDTIEYVHKPMSKDETKEKFWVVRKWFYNPDETDMDKQYYSLESALEALDETNMDGYDKGETGSVYEVTAT